MATDWRDLGHKTYYVRNKEIYRTGSDYPSQPGYVRDVARQSAEAAQGRAGLLHLSRSLDDSFGRQHAPGEAQQTLERNQYDQGVAESARDALQEYNRQRGTGNGSKARALRNPRMLEK